MKKFVLKSIVAAIGVVATSASFAVVTTVVDFDAAAPTVNKFARELPYVTATPLNPAAAANSLNFTTKIGFGVSNGQTRYIRVDYANAILNAPHAAVAGTDIDVGGTVAIVQGGQAGDAYVIYQLTATSDLAATAVVNMKVPALRVTSTGSAVAATYSLHETAVSAVAGASGLGLLYSKTANIATFATGLAFALTTNSTTASVEASFKKFTTATAVDGAIGKLAKIGAVAYGAATGVKKNDGTAVTLADLVAAGTKLVVTGDFTAAAGADTAAKLTNVYLAGGASCAAGTAATAFVGTQAGASFTINTTAVATDVCYAITGTTSVPAESYTARIDVSAATGTSTANLAAAALGSIVRDGTELQAPFVTIHPDYLSRMVLTSQHTADATVEFSAITEDGVTVPAINATATLKAGKQLIINVKDIVPALSTGTRFAIRAIIAAPNTKISGVYNVMNYNATTGHTSSLSSYPLLRPGTN